MWIMLCVEQCRCQQSTTVRYRTCPHVTMLACTIKITVCAIVYTWLLAPTDSRQTSWLQHISGVRNPKAPWPSICAGGAMEHLRRRQKNRGNVWYASAEILAFHVLELLLGCIYSTTTYIFIIYWFLDSVSHVFPCGCICVFFVDHTNVACNLFWPGQYYYGNYCNRTWLILGVNRRHPFALCAVHIWNCVRWHYPKLRTYAVPICIVS